MAGGPNWVVHGTAQAFVQIRCCVCGAASGGASGSLSLQRCSRCKCVWYCSSLCQSTHWPRHEKACNASARAIAASRALKGTFCPLPHGISNSTPTQSFEKKPVPAWVTDAGDAIASFQAQIRDVKHRIREQQRSRELRRKEAQDAADGPFGAFIPLASFNGDCTDSCTMSLPNDEPAQIASSGTYSSHNVMPRLPDDVAVISFNRIDGIKQDISPSKIHNDGTTSLDSLEKRESVVGKFATEISGLYQNKNSHHFSPYQEVYRLQETADGSGDRARILLLNHQRKITRALPWTRTFTGKNKKKTAREEAVKVALQVLDKEAALNRS